jgi:hypothetical protein
MQTNTPSKKLTTRPDYWREDFRCYGSQWGYIPGSPICNLIDFVREVYRAKYGSDYRLIPLSDGKYQVTHGSNLDGSKYLYGEEHLVEHAAQFSVTVLPISQLSDDKYALLKNYENTLKDREAQNKKKCHSPCRICLRSTGEYITMDSGKTLWPNIGAAKSALRLDMINEVFSRRYQTKPLNMSFKELEEENSHMFDVFMNEFVVFVELVGPSSL